MGNLTPVVKFENVPVHNILTPELEKKIGMEVQSAYQSYSQNVI